MFWLHAAFVPPAHLKPGGQLMQPVPMEYVPLAHTLQLAALLSVEYEFDAHLAQRDASSLDGCATYSPGMHCVFALQNVLPCSVWYLPLSHTLQWSFDPCETAALPKRPATHAVH